MESKKVNLIETKNKKVVTEPWGEGEKERKAVDQKAIKFFFRLQE